MLKCFKNFDAKKTGLFAAGVLFGTAGIKILSSKDAKKLYTNCTAAVLRAKEVVLKTATKVQEMFSTPVFAYRSQNVKLTKIKARTYRLQQFTVSLMILAFSLNKLF